MIGLILAAGDNVRIADDLDCPSKVLVPIGGRSLILRDMDLMSTIVDQFIVVVGKAGEYIRHEILMSEYSDRTLFVIQNVATGTLDAIKTALPYIYEDVFLVLGDELLIDDKLRSMANDFQTKDVGISVGIIPNSDDSLIRDAYAMHYNNGFIDLFIEKPKIIFNKDRGTGFYMIKKDVFQLLSEIDPVKKDVVDLFNHALRKGFKATSFKVAEDEYNINTIDHLKKAEKAFENWKR